MDIGLGGYSAQGVTVNGQQMASEYADCRRPDSDGEYLHSVGHADGKSSYIPVLAELVSSKNECSGCHVSDTEGSECQHIILHYSMIRTVG